MSNRRFRRVPFEAEVEVSSSNQSWTCELHDIALKGALLAADERLPMTLGKEYFLSITLPGSELTLDFQAELVHQEECQYGFKFLTENLETMTHLRKLIELNTGDPDATRTELDAWLDN